MLGQGGRDGYICEGHWSGGTPDLGRTRLRVGANNERPGEAGPGDVIDDRVGRTILVGRNEREQELILATLRSTGGNRTLTAAQLGISPRTLRHKLQQLKAAGVAMTA